MAARACHTCKIAYPTIILECRMCGTTLAYTALVDPDADWESRTTVVATRAIPRLGIGAVKTKGRHWLYGGDVRGTGWEAPLHDFALFELLDGSIAEVQGYDRSRDRYWVELIGMTTGEVA